MLHVEEHFKQVPLCLDIHTSAHNQDIYNKRQSQKNLRISAMINRNNLIRECKL